LWCFPLVLLYYSNPGVVCYKILSAPGILKERIEMIILREKEFASTKESRKKSKEMNEKDKTRKSLDNAQAGTAAAGVGTIIAGSRLKKAAEKMEKVVKENNGGDMEFVKKMQKKGKAAKGMDKASLALVGASLGLGIAKHTRDIIKGKKAKEEKKK
jgi:hypothetical protein